MRRLISVKEQDLVARAASIRKNLKYLIKNESGIHVNRRKQDDGVLFFVEHEDYAGDHHRESYFPSISRVHVCQYFEVWRNEGQSWFLHQSSLSVYERPDVAMGKYKELICLHIDPNEPTAERHWRLKKCLHFHVCASDDPLPHLHLPFEYSQYAQVLKSLGALEQRMIAAVKVIRHQLLDPKIDEGLRIKLS